MTITCKLRYWKGVACTLALSMLAVSAIAYEWEYVHRPVEGVYAVYGGGIGDPYKPTKDDHKID